MIDVKRKYDILLRQSNTSLTEEFLSEFENETFIPLDDNQENYNEFYSLGYWQVDCPVYVEGYKIFSLTNNNGDSGYFYNVIYRNIGNKLIKAIRGVVTYINAFDEEVVSKSFELLDINSKSGDLFGYNMCAMVPQNNIRYLKIDILKVMYKNREYWDIDYSRIEYIDLQETRTQASFSSDDAYDFDELKLYWKYLSNGHELTNEFINNDKYFLCPCGTINFAVSHKCCNCGTSLDVIKDKFTPKKRRLEIQTENWKKFSNNFQTRTVTYNKHIEELAFNILHKVSKYILTKSSLFTSKLDNRSVKKNADSLKLSVDQYSITIKYLVNIGVIKNTDKNFLIIIDHITLRSFNLREFDTISRESLNEYINVIKDLLT